MGFFDTKSTTKPDMPGYADKFYRTLFKKMDTAFAQGPQVYNKSTVPGFSKSTKAAFGGMKGLAGANTAVTNEDGTVTYNGMSGNLQDIMSNGGFTQGQLDTMGGMRTLIDNPGLAELINGNGLTGEQNRAYSSLQDTVYRNNAAFQDQFDRGGLTTDQQLVADRYRDDMNADFSLDANPAYAAVRERALKEQQMALDANAAKSGRYGGGSSQTILAREQGNLGANMDVAQYDKWRASRDAAAGGLAALSQTGFGNQLGISTAQQQGLGSIADMGQLGVDNRNTAISLKSGLQNNLFNAENAGLGRMGEAYQTALAPYQTQRAVGAEYEAKNAERIADKLRRFEGNDPYNHIARYMQLASGAPQGQVTTTSPSLAQYATAGGLAALTLPSLMNWGSAGATAGGMAV